MTPEEETALRSQVAQLRKALGDVVEFNKGLQGNIIAAGQPRERWERITAALADTAASEKWLVDRELRMLVGAATQQQTIDIAVVNGTREVPGELTDALAARDTRVRADARRAAIEAAAKLIREHLLPNSQRAISWHEAADCLEAVFALKETP